MFERFTDLARRAVVLAQESCRELRHTQIGPEHLLIGAVSCEGGIAHAVFQERGVTPSQLRTLLAELAPNGVRAPEGHLPFSADAKKALESSLREALALGHNYIGTEHMILGLIRDETSLVRPLLERCRINPSELRDSIMQALSEGLESASSRGQDGERPDREKRSGSVLDAYGKNLTQLAKDGKLDPLVGREKEIKRLQQVLSRRNKSNPCLVGEPGVGKTAIVEGLAQAIAFGTVPGPLKDVQLYTIDMGSMVAGSRYRGDFEERMKKLMKEVTSRTDVVLFLDEIHTLVGAGAAEGSIDASNMLKPALARGEIRVIGATTFDEFRKHFEKDPALERRFQPITVVPPTNAQTIEILRGLRPSLEKHHECTIDEEAIDTAVRLADRYIADRQMPDKAIDLLDEAGALLRIEPELDAPLDENGRRRLTSTVVERVCAEATNVPTERVGRDDAERLLAMEKSLAVRVKGQADALRHLSRSIRRARAGLGDPARPLGSFLFLGPTGVGKTEAAKALAEFLFASEERLIALDMSEYQEAHSVSRLIGAPPGYVGYEEPGQLTEAVRRNPYSVVLFDEVEKAHPDVFNTLLQVLEEGRVTDAKGRVVDFKNTIIILTSNLGSDRIAKSAPGFARVGDRSVRLEADTREAAKKFFRPELLNRLDEIVVFQPLDRELMFDITKKFTDLLAMRLLAQATVTLEVTDAATGFLVETGFDEVYGARPLRRVVQRLIEDPLSEGLLSGLIQTGDNVVVDLDADGETLTVRPSPLTQTPPSQEINS
jgi:ATP-dependent Clp protease ATP-binding subunit ClpC